jgi:hypothetical protein
MGLLIVLIILPRPMQAAVAQSLWAKAACEANSELGGTYEKYFMAVINRAKKDHADAHYNQPSAKCDSRMADLSRIPCERATMQTNSGVGAFA